MGGAELGLRRFPNGLTQLLASVGKENTLMNQYRHEGTDISITNFGVDTQPYLLLTKLRDCTHLL